MSQIENQIAQEIGYLVFIFNSLENTLDTILFELLHPRTNDFGKIITDGYSFSRKLSLLKKMYESYFDSLDDENGMEELKLITGKINAINIKRNQIIHAAWEDYFYDDYECTVRIKWKISKGKINELKIEPNPKSISKIRNEIESLDSRLYEFHEAHFYS